MQGPDADRRARAAAWGTSLAVHTLLTAGAFYGGGSPAGLESAGDDPAREIGVVLRDTPRPPAPFDADSTSDLEAETVRVTDAAQESPAPLPPSPFSDLLERLVAPAEAPGARAAAAAGGTPEPPPAAGGGRPRLPIGQARVPFLGVEGVGSRFVYVLDRSTSMDGAPLRAVKAHLVASLEAIGPPQQFHILFFNTRVSSLDLTGGQRRVAFGTDENKRRAARFVLAVTADGGTERREALDEALRFRPDVVFFLTDDDTPMTPGQLAEVVAKAQGSVTIHAIEFGKGPDHGRRNFLSELAELTGGQRAYVDTTLLPR